MKKPFLRRVAALALVVAAGVAGLAALPAQAHRGWLMPSATVLSGNDGDLWVTVDAAVSNDLFYFEHQPMRLEGLVVTAPDGSVAKAENASTGRYRSTFDVKLPLPGTYKIAVVNDGWFASYRSGGEMKRARGTVESLKKEIPADATDVNVSQSQTRVEVFVTAGKPTTKALAPTGRGLEMQPLTHPNDLIAGETARFRFLQDGKPAVGLEVAVIPGGIRYRDKLQETGYKTDAKGEIAVTWQGPGMYWLNAAPGRPEGGPAGMGGPGGPRPTGPVGTFDKPIKRVGYTATLEVLPQ